MVSSNPRTPSSEIERFVWRRAFRAGKVRRNDLIATFNCSETTATNTLKKVLNNSAGLLEKKGRYVVPSPWTRDTPPKWAGEEDLLLQLERRNHNLEDSTKIGYRTTGASPDTGLTFDELPVIYDEWVKLRVGKEGSLWAVCEAIREGKTLWIEYTSMRRHQSSRWRRILPLSLQRTDETWRVYAHDVEDEDYPLRSYKLYRISNYAKDDDKPPKSLRIANPLPPEQTYTVQWNPHLSDDQRQVLSVEFGVENQQLTLSSLGVYEFKIRYEGESAGDVAWPPFARISIK